MAGPPLITGAHRDSRAPSGPAGLGGRRSRSREAAAVARAEAVSCGDGAVSLAAETEPSAWLRRHAAAERPSGHRGSRLRVAEGAHSTPPASRRSSQRGSITSDVRRPFGRRPRGSRLAECARGGGSVHGLRTCSSAPNPPATGRPRPPAPRCPSTRPGAPELIMIVRTDSMSEIQGCGQPQP